MVEVGGDVEAVIPVPESATVWVVPSDVSLNASEPVRVPLVVGVKVTATVQVLLVLETEEQVLVCVKSPVIKMFCIAEVGVMEATVTVAEATGEVPPVPVQATE